MWRQPSCGKGEGGRAPAACPHTSSDTDAPTPRCSGSSTQPDAPRTPQPWRPPGRPCERRSAPPPRAAQCPQSTSVPSTSALSEVRNFSARYGRAGSMQSGPSFRALFTVRLTASNLMRSGGKGRSRLTIPDTSSEVVPARACNRRRQGLPACGCEADSAAHSPPSSAPHRFQAARYPPRARQSTGRRTQGLAIRRRIGLGRSPSFPVTAPTFLYECQDYDEQRN